MVVSIRGFAIRPSRRGDDLERLLTGLQRLHVIYVGTSGSTVALRVLPAGKQTLRFEWFGIKGFAFPPACGTITVSSFGGMVRTLAIRLEHHVATGIGSRVFDEVVGQRVVRDAMRRLLRISQRILSGGPETPLLIALDGPVEFPIDR